MGILLTSAIAFVLAAFGVYGVISYFVTQRTHELGIRLALGASASKLRWLVVKQGTVLGVSGVLLGAVVSLAVSRLLQALLFGVTPRDPITFVRSPTMSGRLLSSASTRSIPV